MERKFAWDDNRVSQALRMLRDAAIVIEPRYRIEVIKDDHPDNRILECAIEASADYLITGDRRHLLPLGEHGSARIVNAARFLSELDD